MALRALQFWGFGFFWSSGDWELSRSTDGKALQKLTLLWLCPRVLNAGFGGGGIGALWLARPSAEMHPIENREFRG